MDSGQDLDELPSEVAVASLGEEATALSGPRYDRLARQGLHDEEASPEHRRIRLEPQGPRRRDRGGLERAQDLEVPDWIGLVAENADGPVPSNHEVVAPVAVVEADDDRVVTHSLGCL